MASPQNGQGTGPSVRRVPLGAVPGQVGERADDRVEDRVDRAGPVDAVAVLGPWPWRIWSMASFSARVWASARATASGPSDACRSG